MLVSVHEFILNLHFACYLIRNFLAGIDTDKNKYPIGSGRCTFVDYKNYVKAVNAAFVDIKTPRFTKKVSFSYFPIFANIGIVFF